MFVVDFVVWTAFSLAIIAVLLVALGYYLRHAQDLALYHPDNPPNSTVSCDAPHSWGIRHGERVEIVTADGVTLAGYLMKFQLPQQQQSSHQQQYRQNTSPSAGSATATTAATLASAAAAASSIPTVQTGTSSATTAVAATTVVAPTLLVYFHGNAGNVGHRLPIAKYMIETARCDVLMVDYRSYGLSDAVRPCEVGLQLDAVAVMEYVQRCAAPGSKIVVMGVSLGGAVALYLASHRKYRGSIAGLILENTFTSISDMADALVDPIVSRRFPGVGGKLLLFVAKRLVKPLVIQIHWRSIDRVPQVICPMLFLSGLSDELVPPGQMQQLFEAAVRAPFRRMVCFEGGRHNDLCAKDGFFDHISKFIDERIRSAAASTNQQLPQQRK